MDARMRPKRKRNLPPVKLNHAGVGRRHFRKRKHDCLGSIRGFYAALACVLLGLDHDLPAALVAVTDSGQLRNRPVICKAREIARYRAQPETPVEFGLTESDL